VSEARQVDLERGRADGVFEGGGVKGIAFAGALAAAEAELGIREWVNVAGTSAGAIAACLVAAGYGAEALREILRDADYQRFADYGAGGRLIGAPLNALRLRGIARGEYFKEWLRDRLAESPLKKRDPTFADLERADIPAEASPQHREAVRYRLRVIASDVSEGRMLVLPQDIEGYRDRDGTELRPDELKVVDAVRMSMSFPFFFNPVTLRKRSGDRLREHLIVDGGLLSNFPVWLFDGKPIHRPTFGFRLHPGKGPEVPYYAPVPKPLWEVPLVKALLHAATAAWDERMQLATKVRTVRIPTFEIATLDFGLSVADAERLYESGRAAATEFFRTETRYIDQYGQTAPGPAHLRR
jgi:NTE family protein